MADFLYSDQPGRARALLAEFRGVPGLPDTAEHALEGEWGSLALVLPPHQAEALDRTPGRTTVVLGTPIVRLPGTPPALVHVGERRRLLHEALAAADFDPGAALDGGFLVLALDESTGGISLITDRFGFLPAFAAPGVIGSHPDAVARAAGCADSPDPVSAGDLVANLTCTFPYTLYDGVRQLAPGSTHAFPGGDVRPYWEPRETAPFSDRHEAAAALRAALLTSVADACAGSDRVGVLLSGGEDSRAVLAAVPRGVRADAFIYAEWESREVRTARRAAHAYGAELRVGVRAPDHYQAGFPRTAALVGSGHLFVDVHGLGLHAQLGLDALPVVLGGLSADSLLKATYSPQKPAAFHSPRLPSLRRELLDAVDERRNAFRARLLELRPDSADEWLQLWPFSMRKHGGNMDGNRRLFRVHEAFHAAGVLDVAAAAPAAWKRGRRLYHEALRPLFAPSRFIPHAEYRFPYYRGLGNLLLVPPLLAARGARALVTGELRRRHRPWPRWSALAFDPRLRAHEALLSDGAHPLHGVLEGPLDTTGWSALQRLMLQQLAYLTRG